MIAPNQDVDRHPCPVLPERRQGIFRDRRLGRGRIAPTFNGLTLIERWQGSSWTQVASPSPGTRDNTLTDVAGTAPNDVWAVGYSRDLPYGNRARHSLIEHYDGSGWSRVPSPDVDTQTVLYGVAALSSTNAWAVGYASNKGAVVMRFDGHSWIATSPPQLSSLTAIAALSASDIWAAGSDATGNVVLANWRGSGWTITAAPALTGAGTPSLTGLAAAAPSTVLGVGSVWDGTNGTGRPMAVRTTNG